MHKIMGLVLWLGLIIEHGVRLNRCLFYLVWRLRSCSSSYRPALMSILARIYGKCNRIRYMCHCYLAKLRS